MILRYKSHTLKIEKRHVKILRKAPSQKKFKFQLVSDFDF